MYNFELFLGQYVLRNCRHYVFAFLRSSLLCAYDVTSDIKGTVEENYEFLFHIIRSVFNCLYIDI